MDINLNVDPYNYTAIVLLDYLGCFEPTQAQIDEIAIRVKECLGKVENINTGLAANDFKEITKTSGKC